jgi:glycerate 2-kinase
MRIVLAPDSFKDSLSAIAVCEAMTRGVRAAAPSAETVPVPVADGGEGTAGAMAAASGGRIEKVRVTGPLGRPVDASFAVLDGGAVAVVEMAQASGLERVPAAARNPMVTTSFGTGEMIRHVLDLGIRRLIIGLGGSATADCGAGMAQALGARFLREDGSEIQAPMTGADMDEAAMVALDGLHPAIRETDVVAACDVEDPLLGPAGAVMTYGRQKGASEEDLVALERGMKRTASAIEAAAGRRVRDIPGAGAAGGMGAGLAALLGASLRPGIELVLETVRFDEKLEKADLVLTGEGKIDCQTGRGKAVLGVARAAKRRGIPAIAIAGTIEGGLERLYAEGLSAAFPICRGPMTIKESIAGAGPLVAETTNGIVRLFLART